MDWDVVFFRVLEVNMLKLLPKLMMHIKLVNHYISGQRVVKERKQDLGYHKVLNQ